MQKLKDYLSALIEAVFGKKKSFISNQAMLDLNHIIEIEGDSYIAPCDGAVRALINDEYDGSLGSGYISIYGVALKSTLSQVVYPNDASGNKTVWQSVAKGDQVMFSRRNVNEPSWQKHFFRTIVGGGQALLKKVWGGELCKRLNRFSKPFLVSLLRKPISQTTLNQQVRIGLQTNSRPQGKGESHKQLLKQADQLPQLTTGGYVCKQTALGYESKLSIAHSSYLSTQRDLFLQHSLLEKDGGLITSSRTQRLCHQLLACLSRQSVQSNLAIQGGTL